jgi:hypothetical protein
MPSGQAAERMNVSAQRDVVLLHMVPFHMAIRIVGAVPARSVEIGKVFKFGWIPIDAVSAKYEATIAG